MQGPDNIQIKREFVPVAFIKFANGEGFKVNHFSKFVNLS